MKDRFCVALTMVLFLLVPARGRPKPHYTFILPDGYLGFVQVIFNDPQASRLPIQKNEGRLIDVPESGIPRTSNLLVLDAGARDEFYYRVQLPGGGIKLEHSTHSGFTVTSTDGKGQGYSWYLFIGPPELRAKVPDADWDKVVEEYAKAHGGKTRIESSGPYPTPGRMTSGVLE